MACLSRQAAIIIGAHGNASGAAYDAVKVDGQRCRGFGCGVRPRLAPGVGVAAGPGFSPSGVGSFAGSFSSLINVLRGGFVLHRPALLSVRRLRGVIKLGDRYFVALRWKWVFDVLTQSDRVDVSRAVRA